MFRRVSDGVAVPASIRLNDGVFLIGSINCGTSGRLEALLNSDCAFIEFVSRDGQQRFIARHQVASIEPIGLVSQPELPEIDGQNSAYMVLGLARDATPEQAMLAYQKLIRLYHPEKWTGAEIPFEFSRYAIEKTRQINAALTTVRASMQLRDEDRQAALRRGPLFGLSKVG